MGESEKMNDRRNVSKPGEKVAINTVNLISDIQDLIEEARVAVATTVNTALTMLYWRVGRRIGAEILNGERAEYGKKILPSLSAKLTAEYGRGWSERNLAYMIRFSEVMADPQILQTLCAKLSWSHFRQIIYIEDSPFRRRPTCMNC